MKQEDARVILTQFVHEFFHEHINEFLTSESEFVPSPYEALGLDKEQGTQTAVVAHFAAYCLSCGYWEV